MTVKTEIPSSLVTWPEVTLTPADLTLILMESSVFSQETPERSVFPVSLTSPSVFSLDKHCFDSLCNQIQSTDNLPTFTSRDAFSAGNHRSDSLVLRVWRSERDILAKRDIEKILPMGCGEMAQG